MTWRIDLIAFEAGPVSVTYYGLLFAAGLVAGFVVTDRFFRLAGKSEEFIAFVPFGFLGPIIGGRLVHFVFYEPAHLMERPSALIRFWDTPGLASHGAGLGLVVAFWLFTRWRPRVSFTWLVDTGSITILLIGGFIRLGNFFRSEIIGTPSDLPWALVFAAFDAVPRHPVQLYEAAGYFALFAVLMVLYARWRDRVLPGWFFGLSLSLTFALRIALDFLKENQSPLTGDMALGMGQILSLPFLVAGLALVVLRRRQYPIAEGNRNA